MGQYRVDLDIFDRRCLTSTNALTELHGCLRDLAPEWLRGLHVYETRRVRRPLDGGDSEAIQRAVEEEVARRKRNGMGPDMGCIELRGGTQELIIILSVSEQPLGTLFVRDAGGRRETKFWRNSIGIQICRARVGNAKSADFAMAAFRRLVDSIGPDYGFGCALEEYWAKNAVVDVYGAQTVDGVDASRHLPGLYWLNFFGAPYTELMGEERLRAAPAEVVERLGSGVLIALSDDPKTWTSDAYRARQEAVLDHVGRQYFFSKDDPQRPTIAPAAFRA